MFLLCALGPWILSSILVLIACGGVYRVGESEVVGFSAECLPVDVFMCDWPSGGLIFSDLCCRGGKKSKGHRTEFHRTKESEKEPTLWALALGLAMNRTIVKQEG